MDSDKNKKAVIYCRVSSIKQTTKGDGLASQEARCREYAQYKGYQVAAVFTDDVSGSLIGRPGMQAMLALESRPDYPRTQGNGVLNQHVCDLLGRIVYAGHVEYEEWGVTLCPARHQGLISFETFQKIQQRLKSAARAPARKDLNEDFPLRGFIARAHCCGPMTACWSRGNDGRYPYYMCFSRGCPDYRKSIRREKLEGEFEALLGELRPSPKLFALAQEAFRELWENRLANAARLSASMKAELAGAQRKIDQLLDRIVETDSETLIAASEGPSESA